MSSRAEKTGLFEAIAVMGKAFASPTRLELLDLLAQAPRTVEELARPGEQSKAGHIEGARSIPIDELDDRLAELPADREVVAYCRGPFCAYAHEAVRRLRDSGRQARRLEDGWPEWRLAGGPQESRAA